MPPTEDPAVEGYRRLLAERLHDGPQQLLTSLSMRLQLLAADVPPEFEADVAEIARQASLLGEELRKLTLGTDDQA